MLSDPPIQPSLDQLLIPIELSPTQSTPPAFDRLTIEEESGGRDRHGSTGTSFGLGSLENPILIDLDSEEGYTESKLGSAQHLNTIIPSLRVTTDPALLPGLPCFAARIHRLTRRSPIISYAHV